MPVIARGFSLVVSLWVLHRAGMLTARRPSFEELRQSWSGILAVGLPASLTNLIVPLTSALITGIVARFGKEAVAALSVCARIDLFAIMAVVALSTVIGPFVGQNIGAREIGRVRTGVVLGQRFSLLYGLGISLLLAIAARWIAPLFSDNTLVIQHIILYLSVAPIGYAARGIYALGNTVLNVMNEPLTASLVTLIQMFGVYLPMAFLGANWFGLIGAFGAIPLAYTVGGTVSYLLVRRKLARLESPADTPDLVSEVVR
ncbi:MAG: MATE family efflux transporter [Bacteroidia bacterium]|nr:MATE family efflux transporter [Bacteroidia bacterium]